MIFKVKIEEALIRRENTNKNEFFELKHFGILIRELTLIERKSKNFNYKSCWNSPEHLSEFTSRGNQTYN